MVLWNSIKYDINSSPKLQGYATALFCEWSSHSGYRNVELFWYLQACIYDDRVHINLSPKLQGYAIALFCECSSHIQAIWVWIAFVIHKPVYLMIVLMIIFFPEQ